MWSPAIPPETREMLGIYDWLTTVYIVSSDVITSLIYLDAFYAGAACGCLPSYT